MTFFNHRRPMWAAIATLGLGLSFAGTAQATPITPDIIFGSGNTNGSFTVTNTELSFPSNPISGNIELGLRAKLRYDASGSPQDIFNYDGVDTYSFDLANGNPPPNRAMWNYEWSVNVEGLKANGDQVTIPQLVESGGRLVLEYDTDPGAGTAFSEYDLFARDAYFGTDATANGDGTYANVFADDSIPLGSTVAQNSVNYGFSFLSGPLGAGIFDLKMTAYSFGGAELASTGITVDVSPVSVPEPGTLALLGLGLTGLVCVRRRRSR